MMICKKCGKEAERGWRFCPNCGSVVLMPNRSIFDEIFSRLRKELKDMNKMMNKDFEVVDISPFSGPSNNQRSPPKQPPSRRGFTIKITRRSNENPKVNVRTYGNVDKRAVKRELVNEMNRMGIKTRSKKNHGKVPNATPQKKSIIQSAKFTEEPRTVVKNDGTRIVVDMDLPDVKKVKDIEISQLVSSVEVRARAGEKAYFKIITKPSNYKMISKKFSEGILHLVFS